MHTRGNGSTEWGDRGALEARGPWYARLAHGVLQRGGPVALLAVAFAAFLMIVVWSDLREIRADMSTAKLSMAAFVERMREAESDRKVLLEKQLRIMQQVCVNGAKDPEAMAVCLK